LGIVAFLASLLFFPTSTSNWLAVVPKHS
jgi:hypothetical protein